MKYTIISVRDIVSNVYGVPQAVQSKGSAIRSFSDEVNRADENNQFYKHPNDFELYHLGYFHDETATYELLNTPERLALASELVINK